MPAAAFAEGFRHVALGIGISDAWRPSLVGVSISLLPSSVRFVATDLHQVAEATLEAGQRQIGPPSQLHDVLVAGHVLGILARSMPNTGELTVRVGAHHVDFATESLTIRALLEPLTFPDCGAFTNPDHQLRLVVRRRALMRALTRVKLLAEHDADLWCEGSPTEVVFRVRHPLLGEAAEACPVDYEGPPFRLGFRAASFIAAVRNLRGRQLELEMGIDPTKPVTISTWERPHLRYHLLPLATPQPPTRIRTRPQSVDPVARM